MIVESVRTVKARFSEFLDVVDREHERVVVTRNGRPVAVLISPDELEGLELTLELLSEPGLLLELEEERRNRERGVPDTPLEDIIEEVRARARKS